MKAGSLDAKFYVGALAFALGCLWVALDSLGWFYSQQTLALYAQASILEMVRQYYTAEVLAICVVAGGLYLSYRSIVAMRGESEPSSIRGILANALTSRRDLRLGAIAAVAYAAIYLVISSIVVYQPNVNFGETYGVSTTSWNAAACCGQPGTVPSLIIYLSPSAHLAVQLLPLDALFAVVVPILVGLNVAVAAYAVRSGEVRTRARWLGSIGVLTGLFTGCPTCAGLFLASAIGGLGATTVAVALAPFQILFVLVSIPVLVVSPLINALSIKRSMSAACPVPSAKAE